MDDCLYKLAGNIAIPAARKEEFNRKVLETLYRGGIRLTENMEVGGQSLTVVKKAMPDQEGIVSFDYSVFEKKKRKVATFDTKTGELITPDRGYCEFGIIMNMVMVLQQAYSEEPCFLTYEGKPVKITGYLDALSTLLGEEIRSANGMNLWEMVEFFHKSPEYEDLSFDDAIDLITNRWDLEQVYFYLLVEDRPIELTAEVERMERAELGEAKLWQLREYMYRMVLRQEGNPEIEPWLKQLLQSGITERQMMAQREDDFGAIAEASLRFPSQAVANVYALARGESFWTVWDRMSICGYADYLEKKESSAEESSQSFPLYIGMRRESEDEFLEMWDGENLELSEELKARLEEWNELLGSTEADPSFDMEEELGKALSEMEKVWGCRYADKTFVEEFLEHGGDVDYARLLMVLQDYLDEGTEFFPELTKMQAKEWVLRRCRAKQDAVFMSAYVSLMTNHSQRLRVLGI